eukprot:CAMPEP_0168548594 /NCGR_PEP_ID=MMETSP0413-20121227/4650_1 /TAXON_ID=136452 /ORGANISM="Filamoeba nolandi, Strain NC-AS-23-1" /LENGTH=261 /DNA_ID=CAMNT_0008578919 /DNA_START=73 /DNA_END=858 /DNA_ORIENTATION=-
MNYSHLAICLVLFAATAFATTASQCTYDYPEVFVFANNKKYPSAANLPFQYSYEAIQAALPITTAQLEAQRLAALSWLESEFGIPQSVAVYDPITHITNYPGYGYVTPILFNDSYTLVSSSDSTLTPRKCYYLALVEFTFLVQNTNFTYGGKFGQLGNIFGGKQPVAGDGISYGYYHILREYGRHARIERKVLMKSLYPSRYDLAWRSHEFLALHDEEWGDGQSIIDVQIYPNAQGQYVSQIWNTWRFNEPYNIYSEWGIN